MTEATIRARLKCNIFKSMGKRNQQRGGKVKNKDVEMAKKNKQLQELPWQKKGGLTTENTKKTPSPQEGMGEEKSKKLHIVNFSGGKDSTAMLLRMLEIKMPIDIILFADTKLELPEMYTYIDKVEKYIGREITRIKTKRSFDDHFYGNYVSGKWKGTRRGMPWLLWRCYWQVIAKSTPLDNACGDNIKYIGIAVDEPKRIKNFPNTVYPLVEWGWDEKKCLEYVKSKGLHNPLYDRFDRLGCWLCPKQSLKSFKALYTHYPDLWQKLLKYEADSPHGLDPHINLKKLAKRFQKELEFAEAQQDLFNFPIPQLKTETMNNEKQNS